MRDNSGGLSQQIHELDLGAQVEVHSAAWYTLPGQHPKPFQLDLNLGNSWGSKEGDPLLHSQHSGEDLQLTDEQTSYQEQQLIWKKGNECMEIQVS